MKRFLTVILALFFSINMVFAGIDRLSPEYLQSVNGFSLSKGIAESVAKRAIKRALKKQTGHRFDVEFEGYTASSIKRGVFKSIDISAKDIVIEDIPLPYLHIKSLTDYNYIDYTKTPVEFKSDMDYAYELILSEDSINAALKDSDYLKIISKVNRIAKPLFVVKQVQTKIVDNKLYILTDYNLPFAKTKDRTFVAKSDFEVVNGKIRAKNVSIDTSYGHLGLNKVANLINYLNPLEFTLGSLDDNKHNANIENINIVDNKVKVDGKIFVRTNKK